MTGQQEDASPEDRLDGEEFDDDERGPLRRCIVTGERKSPDEMIRFVVAPDNFIVPDVDGKLPGRGIWLSASRDVVNTAVAKRSFARAARARVTVPDDLADRLEALLLRRCLELLGLARRAGQAVAGYDKVRGELQGRRGALLLEASDGAAGGRDKLRWLAPALPLVQVLASTELGPAVGREAAVHVLVGRGPLAARLLRETSRLAGFRAGLIDIPGSRPDGRKGTGAGDDKPLPSSAGARDRAGFRAGESGPAGRPDDGRPAGSQGMGGFPREEE